MNKKQTPTWISEQQAADMLGYKPKVMRRFCTGVTKKLPIHTSKLNYKTIVYNKVDIDNYIIERSTIAF